MSGGVLLWHTGFAQALPVCCGALPPSSVICRHGEENRVSLVPKTRAAAPLPLSIAMLSNIAACLVLWNIILRVLSLLVAT
jgi:hypothetical protein